jgi:hypothetical protein
MWRDERRVVMFLAVEQAEMLALVRLELAMLRQKLTETCEPVMEAPAEM